jgi:uncharacterized protein YjbI with pentapeptide repeats/DNA-binding XRE family transcriptional regulator
MTTTPTISKKILNGRKSKALTQSELGGLMSISSQAIGKWERGESLPDIYQLNKLAIIFNVSLDYFVQDSVSKISHTNHLESDTELIVKKDSQVLERDLSKGNWEAFHFSQLLGIAPNISKSNFKDCHFYKMGFRGFKFQDCNIESCDFNSSNLSDASFSGNNILDSKFNEGILTNSNWYKSNLESCDFTNVDFSLTNFELVNIENCQLQNTKWEHTKFLKSNLSKIIFTGRIEFCHFERVSFHKVQFKDAALINTFFKDNKSVKHITFENCKCDQITYDLLNISHANLDGLDIV